MSRHSIPAIIGIALSIAAPLPALATPEAQALLKKADSYRLSPDSSQVDSLVESYRDGKLDKDRRYAVFLKGERRTLVLSRSPVERGQKLLMLGGDFWLVLAGSQRPVRISPIQKLLGEASTGDIATLNWAGDYDGSIASDTEVEGIACVRLDISSQRKGTTYTRIELYLAKSDARPIRADLFLASEKMAKRAEFEMAQVDGRTQVSAMTLFDQIQTNRKTVIHYLSRSARTMPDEVYNPAFLSRNELPE